MATIIAVIVLFATGLLIEAIRLLCLPGVRNQYRTDRWRFVFAGLYRSVVLSGAGNLIGTSDHFGDIPPISGRFLWLLLSFAVALWYLTTLVQPLLLLARFSFPDRYYANNLGGVIIVPVFWAILIVTAISWLAVVVVLLLYCLCAVGLLSCGTSFADWIGVIVGLGWLRLVPKFLKNIGDELEPPEMLVHEDTTPDDATSLNR